MKTILDTIIDHKRLEVDALKRKFKYTDFEESPLFSAPVVSLKSSILSRNFGIIAEIKRKSPSAGAINETIDVVQQGKLYEKSGAAAISCLTDNTFFGGSINDLKMLKEEVSIPVLRKEFIIDEIQLFEAKAAGADAILLIAEALEAEHALHLTIIAQSLGLEVLMECHDKKNLAKINDQVDIIGVNNRDLHLQKTAIESSFDLYPYLPENIVKISESGIKSRDEILKLSALGYQGALIGESILKQNAPDKFIQSIQLQNQTLC